MTIDNVVDIARSTLWVIVKVSAPMLGISLIVGLIISIFQTITSIYAAAKGVYALGKTGAAAWVVSGRILWYHKRWSKPYNHF